MDVIPLPQGTVASLTSMLGQVFDPDPADFVFYKRVVRLEDRTPGAIAEALLVSREGMSDRERLAVRAFAARVDTCTASSLVFYEVAAGFADAVGTARHGIALVDEGSREALWVYMVEAWST